MTVKRWRRILGRSPGPDVPGIFDFFDAGYYINLDARTDRRANFERRAHEAGLAGIERFPAICPPAFPGVAREHFKLGCTLSQHAVVRLAQARRQERILIFEDDCTFIPAFATEFPKYLAALTALEQSASPYAMWDVCYLGGSPHPHYFREDATCERLTEHLVYNPGAVWGAHGYVVHQRCYDKLLACDAYPADMTLICIPPASRIYLMCSELLVYQDDESFSDLWGETVKREELNRADYEAHIWSLRPRS